MTRVRPRTAIAAFMGASLAALVTDRIALYLWATSVIGQFQYFRTAVQAAATSTAPGMSLADGTEPPVWISTVHVKDTLDPPDKPSTLINYFLALEPAVARPSFVSVKGYHLSLIYVPPAVAWTTRIFPLHTPGRTRDYYAYEIEADFGAPNGLPAFRLFRNNNLERRELAPDTRRAPWFP
jgi:hypothetical protein